MFHVWRMNLRVDLIYQNHFMPEAICREETKDGRVAPSMASQSQRFGKTKEAKTFWKLAVCQSWFSLKLLIRYAMASLVKVIIHYPVTKHQSHYIPRIFSPFPAYSPAPSH
jgi:hypothetical protein